jgi:hypothetical protein
LKQIADELEAKPVWQRLPYQTTPVTILKVILRHATT